MDGLVFVLVQDEQKASAIHALSSTWPVGITVQLMLRMQSESVFVLVQRLAKDWLTHALSSMLFLLLLS